ncbi:MAG: DUF3298 domain-containing protein [Butyrivibrio sp.]|uniref:RsiV family protein n=1 Tax=Butyrivibrio sp. TaxID=28121 RepID=UPI001B0489D9|nr:RsiV family protein [Butyrivibrio sp.]MBO6241211.1 DUF3298 domain-containing protein [Butyrivibrio sp.]
MKRKSVRAFTAVVAAAMLVCACGNEDAAEESVQTEDISGEAVSTDKEDADSDSVSEQKDITVVKHKVTCSVDGKERAIGEYPGIVLSDDYKTRYPELATCIGEINEGWEKSIKQNVSEYARFAVDAQDYLPDAVFESDITISIDRADDKLFTILISFYDESGGAHPNHGTTSFNIDPSTGAELSLSQVLDNDENIASIIRDELTKEYPDQAEEFDSYYYQGEGDDSDVFKQKYIDGTYNFSVNGDGLYIFFSPYDIASYAAGYMEITLSPDKYPDLIKSEYILSQPQDMEKIVETKDGESFEVEAIEEGFGSTEDNGVILDNPTWDRYVSDEAGQPSDHHISLTMSKEEKTDWLNTENWADEHGFDYASPEYSDDDYYYLPFNPVEYDYMYNAIEVYDKNITRSFCNYDLSLLCNGEDDEEHKYSNVTQYIRFAKLIDNILYVEISHQGYAKEEQKSAYIAAIDIDTDKLLFKTEPLTANAANFCIIDDTIVCGYGFTEEPDYIYLLDKNTGERVETIPVNSAAEQFEVVGDTLYVATYNTAYEFNINR